MTRCKGRCADGTRCLFEALPGNYGKCKHHRGRKAPKKVKSPKAKAKSKAVNVKRISFDPDRAKATKRVPWKCTGSGCRPSAAFWGTNGMKIGTLVEYGGKVRMLKKDINGRIFWGAPH